MKISVIVPVYNTRYEYLEKCLKSLEDQDFDDYEIIAVNDGSTNGCEKILEEHASFSGKLVYINQENGGTSVARNSGLLKASGDYILFTDADDHISPGCLKTVYDAAVKAGTDILFFGYATNYTNREIRRVLDDPDPSLWDRDTLELAVLRGDKRLGAVEVGAPWGKLIRHDIIRDNNLKYTPGLIKGQDTVFVLSLLDHCRSFSYLPYLGYHYRISGSSVSRRFNPDIVDIMEKTLAAYRDFTEKRNKGEVFKKAVDRKYLNVMLGEYLELLYLHPGNGRPLEERIREYALLTEREPYRKVILDTSPDGMGLFRKTELGLLKRKDLKKLFLIKRAESALRNFVIRKYG
ncbi:MAG: glycosyltransferase [Lachnospiraceae bacterium]|nr:glycosyltransferase [Lachnospiraceae bacterium]